MLLLLLFSLSATSQQKWRLTGNVKEEVPRGIGILQLKNTGMVGMCTSVTSWHLSGPALNYLQIIPENTLFVSLNELLLTRYCLHW